MDRVRLIPTDATEQDERRRRHLDLRDEIEGDPWHQPPSTSALIAERLLVRAAIAREVFSRRRPQYLLDGTAVAQWLRERLSRLDAAIAARQRRNPPATAA